MIKHAVFLALVLFFSFASIRFVFYDFMYWRTIICIRDFASIYYIIFLVFAYYIGQHEPSYRFMRKWFIYGLLATIVISLIEVFKPSFFWGIEIISRVKDTSAFSLIAVGLYFGFEANHSKKRSLYLLLSFITLTLMFVTEARTGYVALAICMIFIIFAGKIKSFSWQLSGMVIIGIAGIILISSGVYSNVDSKIYSTVSHIVSLIDINNTLGLGQKFEDFEEAVSTNEWRKLWWRTIWDTVHANAHTSLFGLGFGYHLGEIFAEIMLEQLFNQQGVEGSGIGQAYEARSPHNFLFTIIGRMGMIGAILFCIFFITLFFTIMTTARKVAAQNHHYKELYWILLPFTILVQGFFSVVMEGPYGAIPCWTLLGLSLNDIVNKRYNFYNPLMIQAYFNNEIDLPDKIKEELSEYMPTINHQQDIYNQPGTGIPTSTKPQTNDTSHSV